MEIAQHTPSMITIMLCERLLINSHYKLFYVDTCTHVHTYRCTNLYMYLQAAVQGVDVLKDVIYNTRDDAMKFRIIKYSLTTKLTHPIKCNNYKL